MIGTRELQLLRALQRHAAVDPVSVLPGDYTAAEYKALNRAAHRLAAKGLAKVRRIWGRDRLGRRAAYLWLMRRTPSLSTWALGRAVTAYERRRPA